MAKVEIDKKKCKGCEFCISVCPKGVIGPADEFNAVGIKPAIVINKDACIGCALCAIMCPEVCIEVWK